MPSSRGPQRKSKAKVPKPPRGSGLNPLGEPAIDQLRIPTEQPQMSYFGFDAHETTPQHDHSYSGTQSASFETTPQHGHSYSSTQSPGFDDQSSWDFFQNQPSFEAPPQGSYPDEHYSFQGATGSTASTSMSDTMLIQRGEIPQTDVMHTVGPARLAKKRGSQRPMPPTPWMAPYPTTRPQIPSTIESSTSQIATSSTYTDSIPTIIVPDATINQTMKGAMKLVTRKLFSLNAMTESLPQCFGPNTTVANFITSKRRGEVANTLSVTCGKVVKFACMGAFHVYRLFPPLYSTTPPVIYQFLGETEEEQLERLKYIWALSGAATFCSLDEQYKIHVQMDPFGGMSGNWKFLAIVKAMDDLTDDKKAEFCRFLHMCIFSFFDMLTTFHADGALAASRSQLVRPTPWLVPTPRPVPACKPVPVPSAPAPAPPHESMPAPGEPTSTPAPFAPKLVSLVLVVKDE
ncbi:uncharacterized protein F5147DRAFT_776452 [Suillus discolor]|uniref:Uncharacterized protein n=1 Tax=Suillus discolor TaxID=1912936 RepID=A0A9P7F2V6_9AGAM|nr:uncharacterized protein F5147DRAFT_776452 [Suillus discolor]KAG2102301.1 hypothetical protein F5147DRAFT_776452 [Suillus discolor]